MNLESSSCSLLPAKHGGNPGSLPGLVHTGRERFQVQSCENPHCHKHRLLSYLPDTVLPRIPPKPAEICKDLKAGLALSERRDVIRGSKRVKHICVRSSCLLPDPGGRKRETVSFCPI